MGNEKKRHHYVPATYLKRFTDNNGFLAACRKDLPCISTKSKPSEIGFRKYYYSQPISKSVSDNNTLEDLFSTFEASWPKTADTLEAALPSNEVLSDLLGFIGFQRVRVPAFRDAIEQAMARFAKRKFDELRQQGLFAPPPEDLPNLLDHVTFAIDPHQSIHAMAKLLEKLGPPLELFGYCILHNHTSVEIITSDNPVCYFESFINDSHITPYRLTGNKEAEFLFPVSPTTLVYGSTTDRKRYARKGLKHIVVKDENRIRRFNCIIGQFAYEAYFSKNKLPSHFAKRFSSISPVLAPEYIGFEPSSMELPPFVFGERTYLPKY